MTKEEIPFNYFHKLFINKCKEIQLEEEKNKIGDLAKWMDSFLLFSTERKELIPICKCLSQRNQRIYKIDIRNNR